MSPEVPANKKRIDIYLDEDLEKRFKEQVFKRKGMKKGNISEAVQEAVLLWIKQWGCKELQGITTIEAKEDEIARLKRHIEDVKWVMDNSDNFRLQYGGQFVVVSNQQIIDHGRDFVNLKKKYPSDVVQYIYKEKPHLIL